MSDKIFRGSPHIKGGSIGKGETVSPKFLHLPSHPPRVIHQRFREFHHYMWYFSRRGGGGWRQRDCYFLLLISLAVCRFHLLKYVSFTHRVEASTLTAKFSFIKSIPNTSCPICRSRLLSILLYIGLVVVYILISGCQTWFLCSLTIPMLCASPILTQHPIKLYRYLWQTSEVKCGTCHLSLQPAPR